MPMLRLRLTGSDDDARACDSPVTKAGHAYDSNENALDSPAGAGSSAAYRFREANGAPKQAPADVVRRFTSGVKKFPGNSAETLKRCGRAAQIVYDADLNGAHRERNS